ncbi:MAG: serine O-acetyltransferase [Rhodospirillales bacterium]|nr:serine O-acetyltransferase [Rhodospirillales bacterium]
MFKNLNEDVRAFMDRDPAAHSALEVILCYPGYHAIVIYRLSNWIWGKNIRVFARFVSHVGKILTGIEIHPGAVVGKRLVIDHGTGVVIGETSVIGDDVTIYHDVTLGGIAPSVESAAQVGLKRHPTVEDGAIIGSGAAVLGPIIIGEGAKIGANSVVTKPVPAGMTAVGVPSKVVMPKDKSKSKDFVAYGTLADGPDPFVQTIENMRREMREMAGRVNELEAQLADTDDKPVKSKKTKRKSASDTNRREAC